MLVLVVNELQLRRRLLTSCFVDEVPTLGYAAPNPISDLRHRFARLAAALATSVGDLLAQRERGVTARPGGETDESRAAGGGKGETDLQAPKAELEVILGAARACWDRRCTREGRIRSSRSNGAKLEGAREGRRATRCEDAVFESFRV